MPLNLDNLIDLPERHEIIGDSFREEYTRQHLKKIDERPTLLIDRLIDRVDYELARYDSNGIHHGGVDTVYDLRFIVDSIRRHLPVCNFLNGFAIGTDLSLRRRGADIICSCGVGWTITSSLLHARFLDTDLESIIQDLNFHIWGSKKPISFEERVQQEIEKYKQSQKIEYKQIKDKIKPINPISSIEID
jgi:hypothetical protein